MKNLFIFLAIFSLMASGNVTAQQPQERSPQQTAEYVSALLSTNDFYALERLTPHELSSLPPVLRLLTDATIGSRFNELPRSCKAIGTLLNEHGGELDEATQGWLFNMLLGNLRILGQYDSAAQIAPC